MLFKTLHITLLSTLVVAVPVTRDHAIFGRAATATEMVQAIVPDAASCPSTGMNAKECVTAAQAVKPLIKAMGSGRFAAAEIGAMIALMAYETGDFKYNIHHFPTDTAGQGTRNMQMANYNLQYAQSIDALKPAVAKITTATTTTGLSDDQKSQILTLVSVDEYTWGSAPWYYDTQCTEDIKGAVKKGDRAGWQAYMKCVGADSTDPKRLAYWTRAKNVMGF